MQRIVIFGNSGSGKSTLAKDYVSKFGLSHLDLDTLAWQDTFPPTRLPLKDSAAAIEQFITANPTWVIEGCYSDLLRLVVKQANEMIFLNSGVETCINNCRNRSWEPHKYPSAEHQNRNLDRLIDWVREYPTRDDEFSLKSHQLIFDEFIGKKREYYSNIRNSGNE